MSDSKQRAGSCERCGASLAPGTLGELCPRCLMALNLATQTEIPGEETGPLGTKVVKPPPRAPAPPAEIARHFPQLEILECLGRGGMGVVYRARQTRLNRLVALKILAPEKEKDPTFAERFTREAQALARLNHPNIVTVHDFGEADGLYYLLMEYVDGVGLRQLLQTKKITPAGALAIVPKICEALQFAHELGIVHRDIKPENILLDTQGRVKIADFGIAKLLGPASGQQVLTEDKQVVGTPNYMAPEQLEKPQTVDHRADIYSLGVVFYEMLTGELPLGKFAPPSKKVQVDVRLDEVVLHALEKEPERRYQQASQMKSDVETIAKAGGGDASAPPLTAAPAAKGDAAARIWAAKKSLAFLFASLCLFIGALISGHKALATHPPESKVTVALLSLLGAVSLAIAVYKHVRAARPTAVAIATLAGLGAIGIVVAILSGAISLPFSSSVPEMPASEKRFPSDAGMISVKTAYGAAGDGVTDDTADIQKAIRENLDQGRTLFFPEGVYVISQRLDWTNHLGQWLPYTTWQGEGTGRSIIRLKDNAPGFQDPAQPVAMVRLGSEGAPVGSKGRGNQAYRNYIFDLAFHTGRGNPGSVGVDFLSRNNGGMMNVEIVDGDGRAQIGLDLRRDPGPCLIENVTVTGFDCGIWVGGSVYGVTFEHITLARQRSAGLRNVNNTVCVRDLQSANAVPALLNDGNYGQVVLLDSSLRGGDPAEVAVVNSGVLFARQITAEGYRNAIRHVGAEVPGLTVDEYVSHPARSLFPGAQRSLNLPTTETPHYHDNDLNHWANVERFGARKDDTGDDAIGIQQAINSGKTTVYFPRGTYVLNQTVVVRGAVKRLLCFNSLFKGTANPSFRFEDVANPPLIMERFRGFGPVEHAGTQPVALKYVVDLKATNQAGSGPWLLEDISAGALAFTRQTVWARQLTTEAASGPLVDNDGGRLWILGFSAEGPQTSLRTRNRGQTEVLGGCLYPLRSGGALPLFINDNSAVSLIYHEIAYAPERRFEQQVQEIRGGVTNRLTHDQLVQHGYGGAMPLHLGH